MMRACRRYRERERDESRGDADAKLDSTARENQKRETGRLRRACPVAWCGKSQRSDYKEESVAREAYLVSQVLADITVRTYIRTRQHVVVPWISGIDASGSRRTTHAWLNTTIAVGSSFLVSIVDRAVTPNPLANVSGTFVSFDRIGINRQEQPEHLSRTWTPVTHKRNVRHAVDDDSLVFDNVFGRLAEVGLDDVVPVQERHLAVRLDPDLCGGGGREGKKRRSRRAG